MPTFFTGHACAVVEADSAEELAVAITSLDPKWKLVQIIQPRPKAAERPTALNQLLKRSKWQAFVAEDGRLAGGSK